MINQGAITDELLVLLADPDGVYKIGDNSAPDDGGWLKGQPGVNLFVPYVVLMTGSLAPRPPQPAIGEYHWFGTFELRHFAGSRAQLSAMSHKVRKQLTGKWTTGDAGDRYDVLHVHIDTLGAYQRVDTVDPPFWQSFDSFRIELHRSRSQ